jgi:hypothetical protein
MIEFSKSEFLVRWMELFREVIRTYSFNNSQKVNFCGVDGSPSALVVCNN